ncbi:MAG: hypothetical protein K2K41_08255 [Ruminiclostridium sp.]|nr:hypothetical protein [Ruminiclostridium sp.]
MLDFLEEKIGVLLDKNEIPHKTDIFLSCGDFLERHTKQPYNAIFLDIVMPDISGFEAAKQIRKLLRNTFGFFLKLHKM